jgi:tetratricopeptide (TPR) repeat protein
MTKATPSAIAFLLSACLASAAVYGAELRDMYFGEALYYAHQGLYFEALERLDSEVKQHNEIDEPQLDTLWYHMDAAKFSLGDFELRYRMHHRAGRAIKAVLEGAVDEVVRNDAAFRLARIHFQKGQLEDAMRALERIDGKVPEAIRDDIEFLRANIYLAQANAKAAIPILKKLQGSEEFGAFAAYNLGIALRENGQLEAAHAQLASAGLISTNDRAELAIKDKANLVLGTIFLEAGQYDQAKLYLDRVRLVGPYSNQALLSAGWASTYAGDFKRAVVPWSILARREVTDSATQEGMMALPYAYGELHVYGRAAIAYGRALDAFGAEVDKLDASIESIMNGRFLEALIREEVRKDKDWVIRLRSLPQTPETFYLMDLLASHDFQTGLQNYLDLADMHRKLLRWQSSFDAYDDIVDIRHDHFEPLLPQVDTKFRELDSRLRLRIEQHKMLVRRRDDLLTTPRPEFLATREEQALLAHLGDLEKQLSRSATPSTLALRERIKRLKGLVIWNVETKYHYRLTKFDENLRGLGEAMRIAQGRYDAYVRARQAATHSYVGYAAPIRRLRTRVRGAVDRVELLMARQGRLLESVAIETLLARRRRLENYRDKVRYALADAYDRAVQTQPGGTEP